MSKREKKEQMMKKYIERIAQVNECEKNIRGKILNNSEYMEWLFKFTNKYPSFSDYNWLYEPDKLCEEDRINIDKLHVLYSIIDDYAHRNYLPYFGENYLKFYKIRCNDIGYNIGEQLAMGGPSYGCERTMAEDNFVDFNDIITNHILPETPIKDYMVKEFEKVIDELYNIGISIDRIKDIFDSLISNLDDLKRNNNFDNASKTKEKVIAKYKKLLDK